jgi:hypothetical protein
VERSVELAFDAGLVPGLDVRDDEVDASVRDLLQVAEPPGQLAQLGCERDALRDVVRAGDRSCTAVERIEECGGVVRAAGELDRLGGLPVAALA